MKIKLTSTRIIIGGFIIAILIGTLLLMLPISNNMNKVSDFSDCLFTATSALCVTGLVVKDTATYWSMFGQTIILILIQLGGLGIIIVTSVIMILLGSKIGLLQRTTLQEALAANRVGGIVKLTKFVINGTIAVEFTGAVLLFLSFKNDYPLFKAIWYSIFHSVSAFCNAGFDLMGEVEKFSSLTSYRTDVLVNIVIMILIIVGGIGFGVWNDVITKKTKFYKYRLQSKIVILTTIVLIISPAVYYYFLELKGYDGIERVISAFFQSVTTRTAGFNTIDLGNLSEVGQAVTIVLMLIGGSPGSTAGGMKTTTFAIMILSTIAIFRKQNELNIFNRRVPVEIVRNALAVFMMYLNLFLFSGFIICNIEKIKLMEAFFEVASALGTVGLTLGITTSLSPISKYIIIFLMYMGRVGGLTFIYAIVVALNRNIGYISEDVTVG